MFELAAGLGASDYRSLCRAVAALPDFASQPTLVRIDDKEPADAKRWRELMCDAKDGASIQWDICPYPFPTISTRPGSNRVTFGLPDKFSDVLDAIALLEPLPFETCSLGTSFWEAWKSADRERWGFGRSHIPHGWGCAFRGAGHDRLVSRRWLDFGPWRVIRRPNDTTFIQFYDLAITDPVEAYEQAKVGHQRMGVDPIGGYIQGIDPDVIAEVEGVYRADERTLDIVVPPGGVVEQQDMRVACGLRLYHRLERVQVDRIDTIAYVFMDREDARAHLHELWLRELQCWYVDERGKHRLDADYRPVPQPPAWVTVVEARGLPPARLQ